MIFIGDRYLVETSDQQDLIVSKDCLRPWITRVPVTIDDFEVKLLSVSPQFDLTEYLKNQLFPDLATYISTLGLISLTQPDPLTLKLTGPTQILPRVLRSIQFYDEYVSKLGTIESKIKLEWQQFESEKLSFKVPQALVGLIIGKQGVNKR